jgi:hypothetical protein
MPKKTVVAQARQCVLSEEQFNTLDCWFEQMDDLVELVRTHAAIESARGPAVTCLNLMKEKVEQADKLVLSCFAVEQRKAAAK